MAQIIIESLYKTQPAEWKKLQEKYDPDNTYFKKYEGRLKEITA
jgi:hypothetical protein